MTMKCVYEIRVKLRDAALLSSPTRRAILLLDSEIPCALAKGDQVGLLPGLEEAASVLGCTWDFKNNRIIIHLAEILATSPQEFVQLLEFMKSQGWCTVVGSDGGATRGA